MVANFNQIGMRGTICPLLNDALKMLRLGQLRATFKLAVSEMSLAEFNKPALLLRDFKS